MRKRTKDGILITVIAACLAYLFVYGTDIPVRIHENVHLQLHRHFTGEDCSMTSLRVPEEDNLLHESYTWQVLCSKSGTEFQEKVTRLGAFAFEAILATVLLLTPVSALGGFMFLRLAKIFMLDSLASPSDLQAINPLMVRAIGIIFLALFLASFPIQYKWSKFLAKAWKQKAKTKTR